MDQQLENELMPNAAPPGIYETEPDRNPGAEQEAAEQRAATASLIPVYEELMDWFEKQIVAADSVTQVMETKVSHKVSADEALIAHSIVKDILISKRQNLQDRYDAFMAERNAEGED